MCYPCTQNNSNFAKFSLQRERTTMEASPHPALGTLLWCDPGFWGRVFHNITLHSWLKFFFGTGCIKCSFNLGRFFCLEMRGKFSIVWVCVRLLPVGQISELIRASSTKFCLFVIRSLFFEEAIPTFSTRMQTVLPILTSGGVVLGRVCYQLGYPV